MYHREELMSALSKVSDCKWASKCREISIRLSKPYWQQIAKLDAIMCKWYNNNVWRKNSYNLRIWHMFDSAEWARQQMIGRVREIHDRLLDMAKLKIEQEKEEK